MSTKDHVVAQLLQPSPLQQYQQHPTLSKRIVELDSQGNEQHQEEVSSVAAVTTTTTGDAQVDDVNQLSILDMMIAAQREAKQQSPGSSKSQSDSKKQSSSGVTGDGSATKGLGFKKGFLSSSSSSSSSSSKKSSSTGSTSRPIIQSSDDAIIDLKKPAPSKGGDSALVLEDVQRALAEDEHPMLKALKQNDWITPDLATKIRSSDVLSRGLSDPRCMAAIQLLQKNPQQAMQQFQHDPVVSMFLKEFASIMASHFESLSGPSTASSSSNSSSGEPASQSRAPLVQELPEIGPLHSKVLSDAESNKRKSKNSAGGGGGGGSEVDKEEEDGRVQKVLYAETLACYLLLSHSTHSLTHSLTHSHPTHCIRFCKTTSCAVC